MRGWLGIALVVGCGRIDFDGSAQCPMVSVGPSLVAALRTPTPPTIDGQFDDWACTEPLVVSESNGTLTSGTTFADSVAVRLEWDVSAVYLAAEITDPSVEGTSTTPWLNDALEIFVGAAAAADGDYGATQRQVVVDHLGQSGVYSNETLLGSAIPPDLRYAVATTPTGYNIEIAFASNVFGVTTLAQAQTLPFDVQVDDGTGSASTGLVWVVARQTTCTCSSCCCNVSGVGDYPACDTLTWGALRLDP